MASRCFLPGNYDKSGNFVSFQEWEKERRKRRCKLNKEITVGFYVFVLVVSFIGILWGLNLFWIGYHNQDSGHNFRIINCEQGTDYVDYYTATKFYTPHEQIVKGNEQQLHGFIITVLCTAIFCLYLGIDVSKIVREIDKEWR